jgi:hypothetical protein
VCKSKRALRLPAPPLLLLSLLLSLSLLSLSLPVPLPLLLSLLTLQLPQTVLFFSESTNPVATTGHCLAPATNQGALTPGSAPAGSSHTVTGSGVAKSEPTTVRGTPPRVPTTRNDSDKTTGARKDTNAAGDVGLLL